MIIYITIKIITIQSHAVKAKDIDKAKFNIIKVGIITKTPITPTIRNRKI